MNDLRSNKTNASDVRASNISLILRTIRENAPLSRADIARVTGLMRSTVSTLTVTLLELGFIKEIGFRNDRSVGKRATLLDMETQKIFILAIKFSNNSVHMARMDLQGNIQADKQYELSGKSSAVVKSKLKTLTQKHLREIKDTGGICFGIGVVVPSPVKDGEMVFTSAFPCLKGVKLKELFREEFDGPIYVSNNADASALAEMWFGEHNDINTLAFVLIDQGIGCGLVLKQELYLGARQLSNEFGHTVIRKGGPMCFCGNDGCITSLASDWAIGQKLLKSGDDILPFELAEDDPESLDRLLKYMLENPEQFKKYTREAARNLGIGIANLVSILIPDVILIDGYLALMPDFLDEVERSCREHVHPLFADTLHISGSQLGENAALIGAGTFVIRELFADPLLVEQASL